VHYYRDYSEKEQCDRYTLSKTGCHFYKARNPMTMQGYFFTERDGKQVMYSDARNARV